MAKLSFTNGSTRFYTRLTPSVADSCYLAHLQEGHTEWFEARDYGEGGDIDGDGRIAAFMLAEDRCRNLKRSEWVRKNYVHIGKPIWDATGYVIDVSLTELGERAINSIQQGYVWIHPDDDGDGGFGVSVPETLLFWRRKISELHPDSSVPDDLRYAIRRVYRLPHIELHELFVDLQSALNARASGLFWDSITRKPDIKKSVSFWKGKIETISTHDDPLFKEIASFCDNPALKPVLRDLTMRKMSLD